jgi:hypothetical protein
LPQQQPTTLSIKVTIRKLPATIWSEYEKTLWEMSWQGYEFDMMEHPWSPLIADLHEYMHLINPNFIHQPPYLGCKVKNPSNSPRSLIFSSIEELHQKTLMTEPQEESWQKMLISQTCITSVQLEFDLVTRRPGEKASCGLYMPPVCHRRNRQELKLGDLVGSMRAELRGYIDRVMWSKMDKI